MSTISKSGMFAGVINRMKASFLPKEEEEAKLTFGGQIVVKTQTPDGKEWMDSTGTIYPEEMLIDGVPVFTIAKTPAQVSVGDIVKLTKSTFATVTSVDGGKIETLSFGGQHRQAKALKDFFLGQATVRVVINPLGSQIGGANMQAILPFLMMCGEGSNKSSFSEMIMLSSIYSARGSNGLAGLCSNPAMLMFMAMKDGGDSKISDLMMAQVMSQMFGGNDFNLFGGIPAPVAPVASVADPAQAE